MAHTDDIIKNRKQLVHEATELTDTEAQNAAQIIYKLQAKYQNRPNTRINLDQLRDEALTRLAEVGILAEMDPTPCFHGEPPIIEILGKVATDAIHKDGFDHERKRWEILKAKERGEDYLGEKERPQPHRPKSS